ncbi:MAG: hypothetical protein JWP11_2287 [Frankiales bacterium]|nr:hypothetical protein [Frankiales bacterium]
MPSIQLRCDTCAEACFLYRLHGTELALCAGCFLQAYPPESTFQRRQRRVRTPGPAAAGCLRLLRSQPPVSGVHRILGRPGR